MFFVTNFIYRERLFTYIELTKQISTEKVGAELTNY